MKWLLLVAFFIMTGKVWGMNREVGTPFFENYFSDVYTAHDRNEAVICDGKGSCYFANFEGLLRYDGQEWSLVTTPGISRVTALASDQGGRVCVGGYNFVGRLRVKDNGEMELEVLQTDVGRKERRIGEVRKIVKWRDGMLFMGERALVWVKGDSVRVTEHSGGCVGGFEGEEEVWIQFETGCWRRMEQQGLGEEVVTGIKNRIWKAMCKLPDGRLVVGTNGGLYVKEGAEWKIVKLEGIPEDVYVNDVVVSADGGIVVATSVYGSLLLDETLALLVRLDEQKGLCSNVVNGLCRDGKGSVWMATGRGIVRMAEASMYSVFTEKEGLQGEVLTMRRAGGVLYVGTYQGLFRLERQGVFRKLKEVQQACWQLSEDGEGQLWAATGNGLFRIVNDRVQKYKEGFTMSVMVDTEDSALIYEGEQEAVYESWDRGRSWRKCVPLGRVVDMVKDRQGFLWLTTVFGEVYRLGSGDTVAVELKGFGEDMGNRTVKGLEEDVVIVSGSGFYRSEGDSLVVCSLFKDSLPEGWWPGICVEDREDRWWMSRGDGKEVVVVKKGRLKEGMCEKLKAIAGYTVRVIYPEGNGVVWLGGSFGLLRVDLEKRDPAYESQPGLFVRKLIRKEERPRDVEVSCVADITGIIKPVEYAFRLRGFELEWSEWKKKGRVEYVRLPYGKYVLEWRVRDVFDRVSTGPEVAFEVKAPFYWQWYAWVIYSLLVVVGVGGIVKWRMYNLLAEKERLEGIVEKRTEELRAQRDEIREKSENLERTLTELEQAQQELVRQEKMATVGKLTQGLVDRILNPLNYIGNFAILSKNLAGEAVQLLAEKDLQMDEEIRMDLMELMDMLSGNLEKISEHGGNTARVLKAMEELLQERKCVLLPTDINVLCRERLELLRKNYAESEGLVLRLQETKAPLLILADKRQLGKVVLSVMHNSVLALLKKKERQEYQPELEVKLEAIGEYVRVSIRDNGIGIEKEILDKVFDPFFTTRTTAEGVGVGLYLSREVILNHQGRITLDSVRGEWTEVVIELKKA